MPPLWASWLPLTAPIELRRVRPWLAGALRSRGDPHPVDPGRSRAAARACRVDVGAGSGGEADHRHRPRGPGLRATSRRTCPTWRRPGTWCVSASRSGSSIGSSRARTRTSTSTSSPTAAWRSSAMLRFRDWLRTHDDERDAVRTRRSANWPRATGASSSSTPMPRPRSSRGSSRERRPREPMMVAR